MLVISLAEWYDKMESTAIDVLVLLLSLTLLEENLWFEREGESDSTENMFLRERPTDIISWSILFFLYFE